MVPLNLSLINNVEDIVGFPSIKVLNSNNSFIIFCSRNAPVTTSFSNLNLEIKFMLYQTMLLKVSLWIGHCHLCMESHLKLHSQSLLRNCTLTKNIYNIFLVYQKIALISLLMVVYILKYSSSSHRFLIKSF